MSENINEIAQYEPLPFDILYQIIIEKDFSPEQVLMMLLRLSKGTKEQFSQSSLWLALIKQQFPFVHFKVPEDQIDVKSLKELAARLLKHVYKDDQTNAGFKKVYGKLHHGRLMGDDYLQLTEWRKAEPINFYDTCDYILSQHPEFIRPFESSTLAYMPPVDLLMLVAKYPSRFIAPARDQNVSIASFLAENILPSHYGLARERDKHYRLFMALLVLADLDGIKQFCDDTSLRDLVKKQSIFLYTACRLGLYEVVNGLIELGFPVNEPYLGCSPVRAACQYGHSDIISLLVRNGAELRAVEDVDQTKFGLKPSRTTSHTLLSAALNYGREIPILLFSLAGKQVIPAHERHRCNLLQQTIELSQRAIFDLLSEYISLPELSSDSALALLACAARCARKSEDNQRLFHHLLSVPLALEKTEAEKIHLMAAVSHTGVAEDFSVLASYLDITTLSAKARMQIFATPGRIFTWEELLKIIPEPYEASKQESVHAVLPSTHFLLEALWQKNLSVVARFMRTFDEDSDKPTKETLVRWLFRIAAQSNHLFAALLTQWPKIEPFVEVTPSAAQVLLGVFHLRALRNLGSEMQVDDMPFLAKVLDTLTPQQERLTVYQPRRGEAEKRLCLILTQEYGWQLPWTLEDVLSLMPTLKRTDGQNAKRFDGEDQKRFTSAAALALRLDNTLDNDISIVKSKQLSIFACTFVTRVLTGLLSEETRTAHLPLAGAILLQRKRGRFIMPLSEAIMKEYPEKNAGILYRIFLAGLHSSLYTEQDGAKFIHALLMEHLSNFSSSGRLAKKTLAAVNPFESAEEVQAFFNSYERIAAATDNALSCLQTDNPLKTIHILSQALFCAPELFSDYPMARRYPYRRFYTSVEPGSTKKMFDNLSWLMESNIPEERLIGLLYEQLKVYAGFAPESTLPGSVHRFFSGRVNHHGALVAEVLKQDNKPFESLENAWQFFTELERLAETRGIRLYDNPVGELSSLKFFLEWQDERCLPEESPGPNFSYPSSR